MVFIYEPKEINMANPARHNSNLNNEYIERFKEVVRGAQSEGFYDANWESGYSYWSEKEHKKIDVAAQVICNRKEFGGLRYEIEIDVDYESDDDGDYYEIRIKFSWS